MIYFFVEIPFRKKVKIGHTDQLIRCRGHGLQVGNSDRLHCAGVIEKFEWHESDLQSQFAHLHHRGDWYHVSADLAKMILADSVPVGGDGRRVLVEWLQRECPSHLARVVRRLEKAAAGDMRLQAALIAAYKEANVTTAGIIKPQKPSPDFPLFAHNSGRWAKKDKGRFLYYGKWNDPQAALRKYLESQCSSRESN